MTKKNLGTAGVATLAAFLTLNLTSKQSKLVQGAATFGAILLVVAMVAPKL